MCLARGKTLRVCGEDVVPIVEEYLGGLGSREVGGEDQFVAEVMARS